jgi:hypothetical protein
VLEKVKSTRDMRVNTQVNTLMVSAVLSTKQLAVPKCCQ